MFFGTWSIRMSTSKVVVIETAESVLEQIKKNARIRSLQDHVLQLAIQFPEEAYAEGLARKLGPSFAGISNSGNAVGIALRNLVQKGELEGPIPIRLPGEPQIRKFYKAVV